MVCFIIIRECYFIKEWIDFREQIDKRNIISLITWDILLSKTNESIYKLWRIYGICENVIKRLNNDKSQSLHTLLYNKIVLSDSLLWWL